MTHSDDKGLIVPPKLAPIEVVIVPISKGDEEREKILAYIEQITISWNGKFRFKVDDREGYRPGWKFNEWELQGVPLRLEVGPRDLEKQQVTMVRRDTGDRSTVPQDSLADTIEIKLEAIQHDIYKRALAMREQYTFLINDYDEFKKRIDDPGGFFWVHWCGDGACEEKLQEETKATIRCIPLKNPYKEEGKCLICGKPSKERVIVAKAY